MLAVDGYNNCGNTENILLYKQRKIKIIIVAYWTALQILKFMILYLTRYAENEHNCYDFVLEFLALMQLEESLPCIATKTDFCREMVLPQTIKAAKYISLFRQLLHEGTVICQTANAWI